MKIIRIDLYEYSLPMNRALPVKGTSTMNRSGFILRLTDDRGYSGWGEAAPLEHFSWETKEQAREQLLSIRQKLLAIDPEELLASVIKDEEASILGLEISPSVGFGIYSSMLDLIASRRKQPIGELLADTVCSRILVNALLDGTTENILSDADAHCRSGYKSLKLKLGRKSQAEEIKLVRQLIDHVPPTVLIRLDCNRTWSSEQLIEFLDRIDMTRIEYLEEPLREFSQYAELPKNVTFPLALDESLVSMSPDELTRIDRLRALVLKPTLLGFVRTLRLARAAQEMGIGCTLSSSLESSVGTTMLAHLASALSTGRHAAGLGTVSWFDDDLLENPVTIENGFIVLESLPSIDRSIRMDLLKEVTRHD
ncbi:MAG: o-succinylbenzoate synthase [bacterium]|nr:o-succinylbenzoate synthase [bacterium]